VQVKLSIAHKIKHIMKIQVKKHSAAYWRVTINNPPLNLFDQEMAEELTSLIDELEQNKDVKVVVFDSADPDYFMAHLDIVRAPELKLDPGPTGLSAWPDFALRIERASFITVGLVRGRARGVGSEFLQALDVRFASKEKAILCQIEVGMGLVPGGGGLERLPLLIGRARAMEVIVGADDFDADTAEKYGWVNRSIPDAELDAFVERFATRVASFDKKAVVTAKQIINERTKTAQVADIASTQQIFFGLLASPESQKRSGSLLKSGLQQPGEVEYNLGDFLGKK
jgi:enoyl-CoA hydratase/carnithine racemase